LFLRSFGLLVNGFVCLWVFRSKSSDERVLRVPPFLIVTNYGLSLSYMVFRQDGSIIALGMYLSFSSLYIISFSFFIRRQFYTLLFGLFFVVGSFVLFLFLGPSPVPPANGYGFIFRVLKTIVVVTLCDTTVLLSLANKLSGMVVQKVHEYADELGRLAYTDRSTGLPNGLQFTRDTQAFDARVSVPWNEGINGRFCMIGFRLEGLETLNEIYGIEFVNGLLSRLTASYRAALERVIRAHPQYAPPEGFSRLYRVESNTFAFLMNCSFREAAYTEEKTILKKLLKEISADYQERLALTFFGGMTTYPDAAATLDQLFKNLLTLIHSRRSEGKGVFMSFDQARYLEHQRRESLRSAIGEGIRKGEFSLVYQPKVVALTAELEGFEALARWTSADFGNVSPAEFIPLAEEVY